MFAVLDENANSMISKEEFAAVTAVLRRRLRRVSHVQRTGLDTSSGRCTSSTHAVPLYGICVIRMYLRTLLRAAGRACVLAAHLSRWTLRMQGEVLTCAVQAERPAAA